MPLNKLAAIASPLCILTCLSIPPASALDVQLTAEREFVEVIHDGEIVKVQRVQDPDHVISGGFAKTSRQCPPFCIQPMQVDPAVQTISELEVFDFMETHLIDGTGLLIDARTPSWHGKGTIPGSINVPFTAFERDLDDPELIATLQSFGVIRRTSVNGFSRTLEKAGLLSGHLKNDHWDFTNAKTLILWCNGPWCGQSPRAIRDLLELGYPAERIRYYRGGMQMWQLFGLTTTVPG